MGKMLSAISKNLAVQYNATGIEHQSAVMRNGAFIVS